MPGSKKLDTDFERQAFNREISQKGKDFAWLPLNEAKKKIDTAATNGTINEKDKSGNAPIHYLLDINKYKRDYDTPDTSRASKYKELVNHILEKNGLDINIKGNGGDRPLGMALDFAYTAANGNPAYPELYRVIQESVVSLLNKGAFVKKDDLKALPKGEQRTADLRKQVKASYEEQRNSFFAKIVALFK
jgi:hypothetical protein